MPEESSGIDYQAVLADLYDRRDKLNQAIAGIEAMVTGGSSARQETNTGVSGPGALLGMSIVDAAKKLLAAKRQPLRNPEIAALFKAGGLVLNSEQPANTIGSVLTRRFNEVGDVVRVERGTWGLKEWYPNRSFKKSEAESDEDKGEPEPKSEPAPSARPVIARRI